MTDQTTESQEVTSVEDVTPKKVIKKTTTVTPPVVTTESPQKVYKTKKTIFRIYQVIWYILGIIEVLLIFRFFLKVLAANSSTGFGYLVYTLSDPFAVPFQGVLAPVVSGVSVWEWSTLLAMIVYFVVAWGLIELFQIMKPVHPEEVEENVDNV